jgi:hypothetical protein
MNSYKKLLLLLLAFSAFCLVLNVKAQDSTIVDQRFPLDGTDTNKYTTAGYVAASYSIIDGLDISNKNYGVCLSVAMPIKHSNFGIAGKLGFSSAPLDHATSRFNEFYGMAGPYFTLQLNTHYSFDFRVLGGVTYAMYPEQQFTQYNEYINTYGTTIADSTVTSYVTIEPINAFIFVMQIGIGFKYEISHNLGLMLNVDYEKRYSLSVTENSTNVSATIDYTYSNSTYSTKTYNYPPNNTPTTYFGNNDPFGFTVFSLGVFYQLGNVALKNK